MAYYPRLRDMREDHDLTQQKLAEYLGMPQPQYFRYEQGLRDIPTDILIQLAKLYNTTTAGRCKHRPLQLVGSRQFFYFTAGLTPSVP